MAEEEEEDFYGTGEGDFMDDVYDDPSMVAEEHAERMGPQACPAPPPGYRPTTSPFPLPDENEEDEEDIYDITDQDMEVEEEQPHSAFGPPLPARPSKVRGGSDV